jgi:23S rRNA pseudouridine1911/1915/1917 synthase
MTNSTIQLNLQIPHAQAGQRLDQALAALLPDYSRSRLKTWIEAGEVLVDGATRKPKDKVFGGEAVAVVAAVADEVPAEPQVIPLEIVYEDKHVVIVNKPAGLVVHPGAGNPDMTLQNALLAFDARYATARRHGASPRQGDQRPADRCAHAACSHEARAHAGRS